MNKIAIIGKGNVGSHLFKALSNTSLTVDIFAARSLSTLSPSYDIILLTVTDTEIENIAGKVDRLVPDFNGIVAHCAGSIDLSPLTTYFKNTGVLYPLQTFNKNIRMERYDEIPFFIEGNSDFVTKELLKLASLISSKVTVLTSFQRLKLHIASVLSCNFANALYLMSKDILDKADISFDYLLPLIEQTTAKVMLNSPEDCQTGPARRGDQIVIEKHLRNLDHNSYSHNLYKLLSTYIADKFKN